MSGFSMLRVDLRALISNTAMNADCFDLVCSFKSPAKDCKFLHSLYVSKIDKVTVAGECGVKESDSRRIQAMAEETIEDIIVAAGPLSDLIQSISSTEDETVLIRTAGNLFEIKGLDGRVVIEAVLNVPPAEGRERVYRAMLTYNSLYEETGMVRMALSETRFNDPVAVMIVDLLVDETFSAELVSTVINDLDAKAAAWREIIQEASSGGGDDESADDDSLPMMKV